MNLRCEACGHVFEAPNPEMMDDYNMVLYREQHRVCPACNDMPPGAIQMPTNRVTNFDDSKLIGMDAPEKVPGRRQTLTLVDFNE